MTVALTKVEYNYTTVALEDGSFQYVITAYVAEQGELPHSLLFVYKITDVVDAAQDEFVRVSTPYDLENISKGREIALDAGSMYYLTSLLTRKYTDLNMSIQSKDAVKSRVNDGVRAWYDYKETFTGSLSYYHPTADATYEQQLQDEYYAARVVRVAAETDLAAAEKDVEDARTAAEAQTQLTEEYKRLYGYVVDVKTFWDAYSNAIKTTTSGQGFAGLTKTYQLSVAQMLATIGISDPSYPTYEYAYTSQESNLDVFANSESNSTKLTTILGTLYNALLVSYNASLQLTTVKNTALSSAVIVKKEAEATVASAQDAEDAALATAVAVCPTFVPVTI